MDSHPNSYISNILLSLTLVYIINNAMLTFNAFHSIYSKLISNSGQEEKERLWKMSALYSSLLIALCLRSLKALWGQRDKQTVTRSRLRRHWNALKWLSFVFYHSLMVLAVSPWNSGALWLQKAHTECLTFMHTYTFNKRMKKKPYCCMQMHTHTGIHLYLYSIKK